MSRLENQFLSIGTPAEQALQTACEELAEEWADSKEALTLAAGSAKSGGQAPAGAVTEADMLDALAWAQAVVERCAVVDAKSGRAAVTKLTCAIPEASA